VTGTGHWVDLYQAEQRLGGGFRLTRRFVLTALHCLRGLSPDEHVGIQLADGARVEGRVCRQDKEADLALVEIGAGHQVTLPIPAADVARDGDRWRGPYRPAAHDVHLSGRVSAGAAQHLCVGGATIEARAANVLFAAPHPGGDAPLRPPGCRPPHRCTATAEPGPRDGHGCPGRRARRPGRRHTGTFRGHRGTPGPARRVGAARPHRPFAWIWTACRAQALAEYDSIRRLLFQDLGLEPGPGLRELWRSILASDPALDSSAAVRREARPIAVRPS
jgi:hypothetical protein